MPYERVGKESTIYKEDFVNRIVAEYGIAKTTANDVYDIFIEVLKKLMKEKKRIVVDGFFQLEPRHRNERWCRNPVDNTKVYVKPHLKYLFRLARVLKDEIESYE